MDYCFEHGIALPEQLSLATFDNRAVVQRKWPGITSMEEVGKKAVEIFLNRIRNPELPPQHHQFFCRLEVRQTTALLG